jgi:hypothetical protein
MAIPRNLPKAVVTYLTKVAIPTIEIDYLLNFTTSLPFLLLLLASTQQPTFKGHFREWVRGPLILNHASSFPVLSASLPPPPATSFSLPSLPLPLFF